MTVGRQVDVPGVIDDGRALIQRAVSRDPTDGAARYFHAVVRLDDGARPDTVIPDLEVAASEGSAQIQSSATALLERLENGTEP